MGVITSNPKFLSKAERCQRHPERLCTRSHPNSECTSWPRSNPLRSLEHSMAEVQARWSICRVRVRGNPRLPRVDVELLFIRQNLVNESIARRNRAKAPDQTTSGRVVVNEENNIRTLNGRIPQLHGNHDWQELSLANHLLLPVDLPVLQHRFGNAFPKELDCLALAVAKNAANGDLPDCVPSHAPAKMS